MDVLVFLIMSVGGWCLALVVWITWDLKINCAKSVAEEAMKELAAIKIAMSIVALTDTQAELCELIVKALKEKPEPDEPIGNDIGSDDEKGVKDVDTHVDTQTGGTCEW